MAYRVEFTSAASLELRKLQRSTQKRISEKIEQLKDDPRPPACKKLKGGNNLYRVRVGNFRIIYKIDDGAMLVLIVKIGDRKDCYD